MVVDASVWVGVFLLQDVHHGTCRAWLSREITARALLAIPIHCLAEASGAVTRRTGLSAHGRRAVRDLLTTPGLELVPIDIGLAREAADAAADYFLRGADALYAALAHRLNLPLVMLDAELRRRTAGYVQAVVL